MPTSSSADRRVRGFSTLRKRSVHDIEDDRKALWSHYVDVVAFLTPSYFVLENVLQFLRSSEFDSLKRSCRPDGRLRGYRLEYFDLDSSLYGSPQKRPRAIVIGRHEHLPPVGPPPQSAVRSSVREAFAGLQADIFNTDLPNRYIEYKDYRVPGPFVGTELHITRTVTDLSLRRYRCIPEGGNRFDIPRHLLAPCWKKHTTGSYDVMGRLRWEEPSVTIRTEFFKPEKGRYLHPTADRSITHLEAARLQGFPDTYKWFGTKVAIARQIGNAVPLHLGAAIGQHLFRALCKHGTRPVEAAA